MEAGEAVRGEFVNGSQESHRHQDKDASGTDGMLALHKEEIDVIGNATALSTPKKGER